MDHLGKMPPYSDNWIRIFNIPETSKHIKGFTLYKIISLVYPKSCPDAVTKVTIWKRFNDFKILHRKLKIRHKSLQIEDKYPNLVSSSYFKRFDPEIIEQRRNSIFQFLEYIGAHQVLFKSIEFVKFFESSHTPQESMNSNISIIRAKLNLPNDPEMLYPLSDSEEEVSSDTDTISSFSSTNLSINQSDEINAEPRSSFTEITDKSDLKSEISQIDSISNSSCNSISSIATEISVKDTSSSLYLSDAAYYFTKAAEFEIDCKYSEAFDNYKAGIAVLLNGVTDDNDASRKLTIKHKIEKYLLRAEKIYNLHLTSAYNELKPHIKRDAELPNIYYKKSLTQLMEYKVLKIIGNGILIVHKDDNNIFYMKVIQKYATTPEIYNINIPINVPFMVKLVKYYESVDAIFLVTEYVKGKNLFEHLKINIPISSDTTNAVFSEDDYEYSDIINECNSNKTQPDTENAASNSNFITEVCTESVTESEDISENIDGANLLNIPLLDLVVKWSAELLLALEKLHVCGIIIIDLNPHNLLLDKNNDILLTFMTDLIDKRGIRYCNVNDHCYCAPEVFGIQEITNAVDWWSFGAILYELLTGMPLWFVHPHGIKTHTILKIPKYVSAEGKSLLRQLLTYEPEDRLGFGENGIQNLKSHPFFANIIWDQLLLNANI